MSPILLNLPDSFETERLILRCARAGEGAQVNAAIRESFSDLQAWMPWAKQLPTVEESEANSRQAQANYMTRADLTLRMVRKSDGCMVGSTGLHPKNWDVPSFEIGYWCRSSCQGQGFSTEAVQAVTAFAFTWLKARRIEIRCDEANSRSQRVAIKSGYGLEGCFVNDDRATDGRLRSTLVYARTM